MLCRLPSGSYQVKILDFGIASFLQDGNPEEAKANDSISGSIHWIAPEQIEGHPATEQSDLYSLGCLFYFALTGLPPFTGKSTEDIAKAHLDHTVRHLSELRKDLPPSMADWIMGLIARNPAARPTRATEALEDFEVITGRRQVSTRAMKLPTIPLEPSEVPVGDSTCSFNFNEIAAAPSVTKPNDPAPQSVPTPSPVAPKADPKRHWLVWIGCAAILALAGLAWLVTGSKSEPKKRLRLSQRVFRFYDCMVLTRSAPKWVRVLSKVFYKRKVPLKSTRNKEACRSSAVSHFSCQRTPSCG
jgi:serine/threonine protein kinase